MEDFHTEPDATTVDFSHEIVDAKRVRLEFEYYIGESTDHQLFLAFNGDEDDDGNDNYEFLLENDTGPGDVQNGDELMVADARRFRSVFGYVEFQTDVRRPSIIANVSNDPGRETLKEGWYEGSDIETVRLWIDEDSTDLDNLQIRLKKVW